MVFIQCTVHIPLIGPSSTPSVLENQSLGRGESAKARLNHKHVRVFPAYNRSTVDPFILYYTFDPYSTYRSESADGARRRAPAACRRPASPSRRSMQLDTCTGYSLLQVQLVIPVKQHVSEMDYPFPSFYVAWVRERGGHTWRGALREASKPIFSLPHSSHVPSLRRKYY